MAQSAKRLGLIPNTHIKSQVLVIVLVLGVETAGSHGIHTPRREKRPAGNDAVIQSLEGNSETLGRVAPLQAKAETEEVDRHLQKVSEQSREMTVPRPALSPLGLGLSPAATA